MRPLVFIATVCAIGWGWGCAAADEKREFFEKKIRPVLVEHCYPCHSAESDEIGGKLRVDHRGGLLTGGESGPVITPGRPDESLILDALRHDGLEMPPEAPLAPAVVSDFEHWIRMGAPDPRVAPKAQSDRNGESEADPEKQKRISESLWSFHPRRDPAIPECALPGWPRDPLDQFVLARMQRHGLQPHRDASPQTLVRRLSFDLTGLAPTAREIEAFVDAFEGHGELATERLVDRLLASPQFGIRWGRHWLDVARYGESNGDDGLGRNATFPHAWRYRDYVIDALNNDLRYDRFLTEQIAGDLLPAESAEQRNRRRIATGFLAIGSKPAAAMNRNFAMDVVDDQINVVCTAVMGLSVACARCHDHKHDPIPTKDYYALAGIFRSTETLYGASANEKLTAPPTPLHELQSRWDSAESRPDRTATPRLPGGYVDAIAALRPLVSETLDTPPVELRVEDRAENEKRVSYSPDEFAATEDARLTGRFDVAARSYSVAFWFRNTIGIAQRPITAYLFSRAKLDDPSLPGDHLGIGGNHDKGRSGKLFVFNGNKKKTSIVGTTVIPKNTWNHIVMVRDAGRVRVYLNGRLEIDESIEAEFGESGEYCLASRSDKFAPLVGNVGHIAVLDRALSPGEAVGLHAVSGQPRGRAPASLIGYAMGVREASKPQDCKIHLNGDGKKLGAVVPRGFLSAYQDIAAGTSEWDSIEMDPRASGRLELAQWLTHPDHPQTARVMVNRIWMHLMGRGIVTTPDDFGVYGARPTHPDLLDHLANRFVAEGWSIKQLIRSIVLSRTYALASRCDQDLIEQDPDNVWLARHSRRRLDAESLRDRVLQASGQLDRSPGQGSAIDGIDKLINWPPGEATDLHRASHHRSVYLCMLRHAPPAELVAFDLPDGVAVVGRRDVTTLPTQSLFLMNSDFAVRQSRRLAESLLGQGHRNDAERVRAAFLAVFGRMPNEEESTRSLALIHWNREQLARRSPAADSAGLDAWAGFCQALMSTNEFRYVD